MAITLRMAIFLLPRHNISAIMMKKRKGAVYDTFFRITGGIADG